MIDRRFLLGAGVGLLVANTAVGQSMSRERPHVFIYENDFDELWDTLRVRYPFFSEKQTDWDKVRAFYRPLAIAASDRASFAEVARRMLFELYDAHTTVWNLPDDSQRSPPFDLLVDVTGRTLTVRSVEPDSAAHDAGLKVGDRVTAVDGAAIPVAMRAIAPRCLRRPDPAAEAFTANAVVAGRRGRARRLTVVSGTAPQRDLLLAAKRQGAKPDIDWRMLDGNVGYIAIRSFADQKVVDIFNEALAALRGTRGLIIDVSDNGGGDTAIALPIMGRFITEPKPYALMRRRQGTGLSQPWTEWVDPRGPFTYTAPVVVLCSHWSGSMAEGFPMGMRDIVGATIVGTPMMGLGAAVYQFKLDRTGLEGQYSAEPVYDTAGRPRWQLEPDVRVRDGADIVAAGRVALETMIAQATLGFRG